MEKGEFVRKAISELESRIEAMYEELKTSSESLDTIYEELLKLKGKNVDEAQDTKIAENKSKIESNLQDINALAKWVEDSESFVSWRNHLERTGFHWDGASSIHCAVSL